MATKYAHAGSNELPSCAFWLFVWVHFPLLFPLIVSKTKAEDIRLQTLAVGLALLLTAEPAQRERRSRWSTSIPKPDLCFDYSDTH